LRGESIADHMYRMAFITMFAPPALASKLDIPRCTRMALVHDMAEGLVGDLTPVDGVPKVEKNRREAETMDWINNSLLGRVFGGSQGQEIRAVWQEYEDSETLESKFVHDVDKIELLLQMVEYERAYSCTLDLSEFSWVATKVVLPEMQEYAKEVLKERKDLWDSKNKAPREPEGARTIKEQHDEYYGQNDAQANGTA
jgi:putative hydrolases of HD superfamily